MSEEEKDKKTDENKPLSVGLLRELIRDEIGGVADKLFPKDVGKKENDRPASDGDIKTQVETALAALKLREKRQARDDEVDKLLEERKKPPTEEKAPIERGRFHKFMGWGE